MEMSECPNIVFHSAQLGELICWYPIKSELMFPLPLVKLINWMLCEALALFYSQRKR